MRKQLRLMSESQLEEEEMRSIIVEKGTNLNFSGDQNADSCVLKFETKQEEKQCFTLLRTLAKTNLGEIGCFQLCRKRKGSDYEQDDVVAIKIYERNRVQGKRGRGMEDWDGELRILQELSSYKERCEFVVRLNGVVELSHAYCAILPLLPNQDLLHYVSFDTEKNIKFREKEIKRLFRCMSDAVSFIHSKQIAHRDISLENFVLNKNLDPVLIDFGVAVKVKVINDADNSCWKLQVGRVGKPCNMAPEVQSNSSYNAFACDIWSLGCCLSTMALKFNMWNEAHEADEKFKHLILDGYLKIFLQKTELSLPLIELLSQLLCFNAESRLPIKGISASDWFKEEEDISEFERRSREEEEDISKIVDSHHSQEDDEEEETMNDTSEEGEEQDEYL